MKNIKLIIATKAFTTLPLFRAIGNLVEDVHTEVHFLMTTKKEYRTLRHTQKLPKFSLYRFREDKKKAV